MKILVLMPCDEQHVYAATGIYKELADEVKDICFAMPMFMEYLIKTKQSKNWGEALYDTLYSAERIYAATEKKDNLIIIGNTQNKNDFDAIFNFQEIEEALPYEDKFIEKWAELVKDDPKLLSYVTNLHSADESMLALKSCAAAAKFLSAYIKTDPHIDELLDEYKDTFKYMEKGLMFVHAIKEKQ